MKKALIIVGVGVLVLLFVRINWNGGQRPVVDESQGEAKAPEIDTTGSAAIKKYGRPQSEHSSTPGENAQEVRSPLQALEIISRAEVSWEKKRGFVDSHKGSFDSYLATGDETLLREAAAKFPNEPQVQFAVLTKNLFPEERRKWIDALKASDSKNSLANYLSAVDFLKNGQRKEAFAELRQAMSKDRFDDYVSENFQNTEEFLSHAGYSDLTAKYTSVLELELPHLSDMKNVAIEVSTEYQQLVGDERLDEADELAMVGLRLGQQMSLGDASRTLISQMVGIAVEKKILSVMDPARQYPDLPLSVDQMRSELQRQQDELKSLIPTVREVVMPHPDEQMLMNYLERFKLQGEENALRWFKRQTGR